MDDGDDLCASFCGSMHQQNGFAMTSITRIADEIFTIDGLCSEQECDAWIASSESLGFQDAMINTEHGQRRVPERRSNARVIVDDADLASDLWSRLDFEVPHPMKGWQAIGLNERFRYYRYDIGQKFDWHADGCVRLSNGQQSFVTFMVYLNDNFVGGETVFRQGLKIAPKKGMALLFAHWLKHTGSEVSSGRKYVLRSDILYRRHA